MPSLPVVSSNSEYARRPEGGFDRERFSRDFANAVEGEVRFGLHDRLLYATDASLYQVEPLGVFIPASVADAVRGVRYCLERGVPLLPRGGGTSLAGQCTNRAVVVDFSGRCTRILEVNAPARTCRVEPGITVDDLSDALASEGLMFAPDPATARHANIGGCIGNNAAGSRSILYGRTSENVLGVDALLADGFVARFEKGAASRHERVGKLTARVIEVVRRNERFIRERFPKTVRRNAGYGLDMVLQALDRSGGDPDGVNLAHLLCGSEGTLAVTLGAQLLLHPRPKSKGLATLGFDSLDAAIESVLPILKTGPSAVELLDDTVIDLAKANTEYRRYVDLMPMPPHGELKAVLYVEYYGQTPEDVRGKFDELRRLIPRASMHAHSDATSIANAWKLRKAGEPLLHGIPGNRKPITFVEDNAVPVEHLEEFVRRFREIVTRHGTRAAYWAHASVGVLHVRPLIDIHDPADRERMQQIAVEVADLAKSLGGVMSGEHGDGRVRGPLLERFYGPELMNAMREIKAIFDPKNLLNPGNIVEPRPIASIAENLRIEPGGVPALVPEVQTYFDFSDQHGLGGAVEMCNGAGVCRKKSGGTMCPSYMGTLDERHSTRGRGNALRLAITGQLRPGSRDPAWDDEQTQQTLALCLSCKACKSECPSNVDIARLKAEYTAQGFRARGGAPLRTRLLAHFRPLARIGSLTAPLANAANGSRLGRWLISRLMGFDPRRTIPPFSRPLTAEFAKGIQPPKRSSGKVVLFGDCFTMYLESGIGAAAKRVLESLGYEVILADVGCCGRTFLSTGMLEEAIDHVDRAIEKLTPFALDDSIGGILVIEPSCASAIKDDWIQLKVAASREIRNKIARKTWLVEEFLASRIADHPELERRAKDCEPGAARAPVLFHGHCHQKALWGAESSAKALRMFAGDRVKVLDSGCCGMAGSFGFGRDKFDLSMRIADLALLPAVRGGLSKEPETVVCASGTSCRHQIHDGAGVKALHPIELIDRWMHGG
ncbi:MAG: FAD-linked oxidase C-terminal domain-containing protein [Phycisphaerales bacterium]|nr:FAD-binding protein [Planctomycetota bacterium]